MIIAFGSANELCDLFQNQNATPEKAIDLSK